MNEFVEECRREWKRLGVPDSVASEMAAELESDLEEAKADGISAEEMLGDDASDPRTFASAWAAERGVVQRTRAGQWLPRRARMVAAIGLFAVIAVIGGVLVVAASPSGNTPLAITAVPGPAAVSPDGRTIAYLRPPLVRRAAPSPGTLEVRVVPATRIVAVDIDDSGVDIRMLGWVLLAVGLAGVVPMTVLSPWVGAGFVAGRDRPAKPS